MKRLVLITGFLIMGMVSLNGYAQQGDGTMNHDMMGHGAMGQERTGGGMVGGMMGHGMGQGMGQGMMGMPAVEGLGNAALFLQHGVELKLTESQIGDLREIQSEQIRETSEPRTDLQIAQLELDGLLDAESPNIDAIGNKIRDVEELRADLMVATVEYAVAARAVLTTEQRTIADDVTGRRGRMRRMNQPGMGGGGGNMGGMGGMGGMEH